jgi:hypothetical protein
MAAMQSISIATEEEKGIFSRANSRPSLVDADEYLENLPRYMPFNPVRAEMLSAAAQYKWSSCGSFSG